MRSPQYILTAAHVQGHASVRLQKYLCLKDHGPKCRADTLCTVLLYAASRIISLAAAYAALRDAPSDTAAHDALLTTLPNFAELQRRINRALQGDLPHALRRRRQPLAIDLTLIPYHGQPLHHHDEIYRSKAKSGTSHFHAYATAYVLRKGLRFTVALISVARHETMPEVLKRLLRAAAKAGVRPRYLLLDRGFCSVDVIRYLQRARYAWLMPLVLRGRKAEHPKGVSGSRIFAGRKRSGWAEYTMTNAAKRSARFRVCIKCRNRRGERGRHGREAVDALEMAVQRRLPKLGLLAHSDRGSQYASEHYQRLLAKHGIARSMSHRANCWDNAPMESFFASLKKELVHDADFATRVEARAAIFEYIEVFYNSKRRHSSLGYVSPAEYEPSE